MNNKGKDYIALAGVMNYNGGEIKIFKQSADPADALLTNWETKLENDVPRLIEHLLEIDRQDLAAMLK